MMKYIFNHMQDMSANSQWINLYPFQDILFLAILRSESIAAKEKADKTPQRALYSLAFLSCAAAGRGTF